MPKRELYELDSLETAIESRVDCAYSPAVDSIVRLRFVDPWDLAEALMTLVDNPVKLETLSRNAIEDVNGRLPFERHLERAHEVLIG